MANFTFKPTATNFFVDWANPSVWTGGIVPNAADADVDFPTVTYVATGQVYNSFVTIHSGESFATHSVTLRDSLLLDGTLNVGGAMTSFQGGTFELGQGTLTAGSLLLDGSYIQGTGQVNVGAFTTNSQINSNQLTIHASTLNNTGTIHAIDGTINLQVSAGGFTQFSSGSLTGGTYSAEGINSNHGTLAFDIGGLITTNATSLTIGSGGMITSHDPATAQDVPLTTSLTAIAPAGSLTLGAGPYSFGDLSVSGHLNLAGAQLGSSNLVITGGGVLQGGAVVNAAVQNNGTILADGTQYGSFSNGYSTNLVLNNAVSGSGHLEIADNGRSVLEIGGATSQTVVFDGSTGTLQLDHPVTFTGTIVPHGLGDKIILPGISADAISGTTYVGDATGGTLTLQQTAGAPISLKFAGNYSQSTFIVSTGPQILSSDPPSLSISVGQASPSGPVCFLAGTMILTDAGERSVETLRPGDVVLTWAGLRKVITWVGSGQAIVDPRDPRSRPVIIRAGALAVQVPRRDLRVTEGHSLFVDGLLVPASSLVNGRSILWDEEARAIAFYHVEVIDHDVLVADGAPAESYRDDGNRILFSRVDGESRACKPPVAPVLTEGPLVDAIWTRLVKRAGAFAALTDDPDLHLIADGARVEPIAVDGSLYRFSLDRAPQRAAICSRAVVPALAGTARDHRRLGVAIRDVSFKSEGETFVINYDSDLLTSGFQEPEHRGGLRWTDGYGELPMTLAPVGETFDISLNVVCFATYEQLGHTALEPVGRVA